MKATLHITNADENLLKAIKSVVNLYPQSKLRIKKNEEITQNGYTKAFESNLLKELKQTKMDYANGKIKAYSVKAFRKALANGDI